MQIQCPSCQGSIEAGPEWAGQVIACPHCSSQLTVPAAPPVAQAHAAPRTPQLNPAAKYQKKKMSGLAITLIIGACLVVAAIAFLVLVMAPQGRSKARSLQLQQAKGVYRAITVFATDTANRSGFPGESDSFAPDSLDELVPNYLKEHQLNYRRASDKGEERFLYFGDRWDPSVAGYNAIVLATKEVSDGKRVVIFNNGGGKVMPEVEYQRRLAKVR